MRRVLQKILSRAFNLWEGWGLWFVCRGGVAGIKKRLPQEASCSNLFCNTGIFHKIAPEWNAAMERKLVLLRRGSNLWSTSVEQDLRNRFCRSPCGACGHWRDMEIHRVKQHYAFFIVSKREYNGISLHRKKSKKPLRNRFFPAASCQKTCFAGRETGFFYFFRLYK